MTAIVVLLAVAACDSSVVPSASPSAPAPSIAPSPSTATPSDGASTEPEASAAPTDAPAGDFAPGSLAVTVSDSLRVRSRPIVDGRSIKYEPVLPIGTQLQVLDGPVEGSGYSWIRVAPVDLTLDGGVADGWVAIADHDGTPWVGLSDAPLAGLAVAQSAVDREPVNVADARRTAADINAFGLALYRRLLAAPGAKLDDKGVVDVTHEHRHGARDGARRGQGLDRVADGHRAARQRVG